MGNFNEKVSNLKTIEHQNGYFNLYCAMPYICAAIILFLFFVWGIVDPSVIQSYHYGGRFSDGYDTYGVMNLPNGFLCWLVWIIIGSVCAVATCFLTKISCSRKILTILYLRQIAEQFVKLDDSPEARQEIFVEKEEEPKVDEQKEAE